jgi:hypothetical protein
LLTGIPYNPALISSGISFKEEVETTEDSDTLFCFYFNWLLSELELPISSSLLVVWCVLNFVK